VGMRRDEAVYATVEHGSLDPDHCVRLVRRIEDIIVINSLQLDTYTNHWQNHVTFTTNGTS